VAKEIAIWLIEGRNKETGETELCDMAGFHESRKSATETAQSFKEESGGWIYKPVKFIRVN